jgi:hypothetical protein
MRVSLWESFRDNPSEGARVYRQIRERLKTIIFSFRSTPFTPESLAAQIHTILDAATYAQLSSETPVIIYQPFSHIEDLCRELNIPPISHDIAYMGGTARVLARRILGIESNPLDLLKDLDTYYTPPITQGELITRFRLFYENHPTASTPSFELEGIQWVPDFTPETLSSIFRGRDVTINQIVVTHNGLYITQKAIDDLTTQSVSIGWAVRDKYGVYTITEASQDALPMYTARQVYRLAKVLIEGKAANMYIPEYGVLPANLSLFWGRYWFLLLHRTLQVKDLNVRSIRIARYIEFLRQVGVVDSLAAWLQYLWDLYANSEYQNWLKPTPSAERNLAWIATKMVSVEFALFAEEVGIDKDRFPWREHYRAEPKGIKTITIPLDFWTQRFRVGDPRQKWQAEFEYSVDCIANRQSRPHFPSYSSEDEGLPTP